MFAVGTDQMLQCTAPRPMLPIDRKWKSNVELAPNCPRCASPNTKFCYYNNYSLSQPRYFCKGCRRYWTKGGSLRNVPVGGGCRKTRRGKSTRLDKNGGQSQVSENYTNNLSSVGNQNEQTIATSSSSDGDSANQPTPARGSDIDLAVIFSQFLNQSTSSDQREILPQEWPNEGIDPWDSNSQNESSVELPVVHRSPESYLLQEIPQVKQHLKEDNNSTVEGLLETDQMNAFGLQNLLAGEVGQDVFWSNSAANIPSFELQQFESFPVDDQLKISANLVPDNWTVFDLYGFELFSKP